MSKACQFAIIVAVFAAMVGATALLLRKISILETRVFVLEAHIKVLETQMVKQAQERYGTPKDERLIGDFPPWYGAPPRPASSTAAPR